MNTVEIYTDGACKGNPGPGGWGALLRSPSGQEKELFGGELNTTNNRMELMAVIEGLKKLKLLKDDVNELRTSLAAAKEHLEQAVAIKDAARERADVAEAELASVRLEQDRLNQMLQGLARRATAAELEIKKLAASDDGDTDGATSGDATEAEIKATVKAMRRRMKHCPGPVSSHTYDRESLAPSWSHPDIWLLGAAVATLSAMRGHITITTDNLLRDLPGTGENESQSVVRQVAEWVARNNLQKDPESASAKLYAAVTPTPAEASEKSHHYIR